MRFGHARKAAVVVALVLGRGRVGAGAERAVEVTGPHFVVYSNAGEGAARAMAARAERVRATFARVWPWARVDTGAPIFLFLSNEAGLRAVLPAGTRQAGQIPGWYAHGPERHYFVARADLRDGEAAVSQALFSGYASPVLAQSFQRLPLWLVNGVGQLFGQTVMQADGVEFGRPPQWLKWTLGRSSPVPLAAVFDRKDYSGLKPEESMVFGSTCWALAHWLVVDQTLAGNRAVGQFLKHVAEGDDAPAALRQSGLDLARVDAVVQAYLRQGEFRAVSLPLPAESGAAWPVRTISSAEWQAVSALFAVELGRGPAAAAAEARAREALRLEPGLVLANEALARALWVQGKLGEARGPLEAAVGASPDRLAARYLAGYLEKDLSEKPEATGQEVDRGLEHARRAVALGPEFAPAHALLADLLLRKGEPPADALSLARRAVSLEPALPTHRLVLAKALARSGDAVRARGECETALLQAPDDDLRKQVEDLRATLPAAPLPTGGAP